MAARLLDLVARLKVVAQKNRAYRRQTAQTGKGGYPLLSLFRARSIVAALASGESNHGPKGSLGEDLRGQKVY